MSATTRPAIVLACVLHLFRPLARLLLRHGVAYPAFAQALKQVFMEAAYDELAHAGKKQTDSAVSLLSGVHRRDVRTLGRLAERTLPSGEEPLTMASVVVARWLSEAELLDDEGRARALPRSGPAPSFDALVAAISSDVRPRSVLDELLRLGLVQEHDGQVQLRDQGFAPRHGFAEMAALLRDNVHDHARAAVANLEGEGNFLEQAVYVDELTQESAERLHRVSARAWRQAFRTVMAEARARWEHDRDHASAADRRWRARFGSYFHSTKDDDAPS